MGRAFATSGIDGSVSSAFDVAMNQLGVLVNADGGLHEKLDFSNDVADGDGDGHRGAHDGVHPAGG